MNCVLKRDQFRRDGIFGRLVSEDDSFSCVTGEHAFDASDGSFVSAVPVGTYTCKKYRSPKFGYDVFVLCDVPGHEFIEIHRGNYPQPDSDGCILLGETIEPSYLDVVGLGQMITASRLTFANFMRLQEGVDEFTLSVISST